jgi:hypothetical protein
VAEGRRRMTGLCQWGYIVATGATGLIFTLLSYLNQRQGRDMLAAILAAAAIVFYVLFVGMFFWR